MASAISCPCRSEILSLFRSTLRAARRFRDANAVACAKRIAIEGFRENLNLSDPSSIAAAFSEGKSRLDLAREQADLLKILAIGPRKIVMHGTVLELTEPRFTYYSAMQSQLVCSKHQKLMEFYQRRSLHSKAINSRLTPYAERILSQGFEESR